MLVILSPAKSLDFEKSKFEAIDLPKFRKESLELISLLRQKDTKDLQKLMEVSEKIANLNVARYKQYSSRFTPKNSKAAAVTFAGDVYRGLEAETLTKKEMDYAQKHLRILSGLYGILKPLDKMQAYRLEMGINLKSEHGKNLYQFWGDKVTKALKNDFRGHRNKVLINLASIEYSKVLDFKKLNVEIVQPVFKEYRGDKLQFISFNAKKARGLMARYIIKDQVEDIEGLKGFDYEGYSFSPEHSKDNKLMFVR